MSKHQEVKPEIRVSTLQNEVVMLKQRFEEMERDNHQSVESIQRYFDVPWNKDLAPFASKHKGKEQIASDSLKQISSFKPGCGGSTNVIQSMEEWRWNIQFQTLVHQMQALETKLDFVADNEKDEKPRKQEQHEELPMQQKKIEDLVRHAIEKQVRGELSKIRKEQQKAQSTRDAAFSNARERDMNVRLKKVVLEMDRQASELQTVKEELRIAQDELRLRGNDVKLLEQSILERSLEAEVTAELQSVKEKLRGIQEEVPLLTDTMNSELKVVKDEMMAIKEVVLDDDKGMKSELKGVKDEMRSIKEVILDDKMNSELKAVKDEMKAVKEEAWLVNTETTTFSVLGKDLEARMTAELQSVKEEIRAIKEEPMRIDAEPPNFDLEEKMHIELRILKDDVTAIKKEAWLVNTEVATVKFLGSDLEVRMLAELQSVKEELNAIQEHSRLTSMDTTKDEIRATEENDTRSADSETTVVEVHEEATRPNSTDLDNTVLFQKEPLQTIDEESRLTNTETSIVDLDERVNVELQALKDEIQAYKDELKALNGEMRIIRDDAQLAEVARIGKDVDDKIIAFWDKASKLEAHLEEQFQKQEERLQTVIDDGGNMSHDAIEKVIETWDVQFEDLLQFIQQSLQEQKSTSRELQSTVQTVKDQHAALQLKLASVTSTWDKKLKLFMEWGQQPVADEQAMYEELRSRILDDFQTIKAANEKTHKMIDDKAMQHQAELDNLINQARVLVDQVLTIKKEIQQERKERLDEDEERKDKLEAWKPLFHDLARKVKQQSKALKAAKVSCKQACAERDAAKSELKTALSTYGDQLQISRSECAAQIRANLDKHKGQLREILLSDDEVVNGLSVVESRDVSDDDMSN